jgi:hypothetical protein
VAYSCALSARLVWVRLHQGYAALLSTSIHEIRQYLYLLSLGIKPVIPSKENEDRSARLVEFDKQAYRRRSIVECLIGWLKECRRVFSRFEKTAKNFGGMVKMAFIQRYLRLTC